MKGLITPFFSRTVSIIKVVQQLRVRLMKDVEEEEIVNETLMNSPCSMLMDQISKHQWILAYLRLFSRPADQEK